MNDPQTKRGPGRPPTFRDTTRLSISMPGDAYAHIRGIADETGETMSAVAWRLIELSLTR